MTETDNTVKLVDAYYAAWGESDFDGLAALLTEDFRFRGAMDQAEGPEDFIALIRRNAPIFGAVEFTDIRREAPAGERPIEGGGDDHGAAHVDPCAAAAGA
jgi:limonene-1,2-epoxide hydrolase